MARDHLACGKRGAQPKMREAAQGHCLMAPEAGRHPGHLAPLLAVWSEPCGLSSLPGTENHNRHSMPNPAQAPSEIKSKEPLPLRVKSWLDHWCLAALEEERWILCI